MGIKFTNNASSNITHALTADATSVSVTPNTGGLFPSIVEGTDYFYATLAGNNGLEIVKVTKRVLDTMTIERAQDNTTSLSFDQGDLFELRIVAADFEDTFSHVETTLEDTVSNVETTLETTVAALHTSVDNKMSSYLPLSGGQMTGNSITRNNDTEYLYFAGGTGTASEPNSGAVVVWGKNHSYFPGCSALFANDGINASELKLYPSAGATINNYPILTSAGGNISGPLKSAAGTYAIMSQVTNSLIRILGGTNPGTGANLDLYGGDSDGSGRFVLRARNSSGYKVLEGTIDGALTWDGNNVLTSAGGTLTGAIIGSESITMRSPSTSSRQIITGGTSTADGGWIGFYGKNAGYPGHVRIVGNNGTNSTELRVFPTGATLAGNNILTSAGGTLTGSNINRNVDTSYIYIGGGTGSANSPNSGGVVVWGKDHAYSPGCAALEASNGTVSNLLRVFPDGAATLNGNSVLTLEASWHSGYNWYVKFSNGLIIQGGYKSIGAQIAGGYESTQTFSLNIPFSSANYTSLINCSGSGVIPGGTENQQTTNFGGRAYGATGATRTWNGSSWIAFGF